MIDCKECNDYVELLLQRGEITKDDMERVAIDRHILKGCDKKTSPYLEWLDFAIMNQQQIDKESTPFPAPPWNKGYMEALLDCRERYLASLTNEGTKQL